MIDEAAPTFAWLIESPMQDERGPYYLCARQISNYWSFEWLPDNQRAIRFSRKQDAESARDTIRRLCPDLFPDVMPMPKAIEHSWNHRPESARTPAGDASHVIESAKRLIFALDPENVKFIGSAKKERSNCVYGLSSAIKDYEALAAMQPVPVDIKAAERAMLEAPPEDEDGYKSYSTLARAVAAAWNLTPMPDAKEGV